MSFTDWLYGVSPTGTFKKFHATEYTQGASGIPLGWTIDNVPYLT